MSAFEFFFSFYGLLLGLSHLGWGHVLMILIGSLLLYLGIGKGFEPLLLLPIGFGAILVNIPMAGLMEEEGVLRFFYDTGVLTEILCAARCNKPACSSPGCVPAS